MNLETRRLDILIAEKVMGIKPDLKCIACGSTNLKIHWLTGNNMCGDCTKNMDYQRKFVDLPDYSTDIKTAWTIVDKFVDMNFSICKKYKGYQARFVSFESGADFCCSYADTAPRAICMAALLVVGEEY